MVKQMILNSRVRRKTLMRKRMLQACGIDVKWQVKFYNIKPAPIVPVDTYDDFLLCFSNRESPMDGRHESAY